MSSSNWTRTKTQTLGAQGLKIPLHAMNYAIYLSLIPVVRNCNLSQDCGCHVDMLSAQCQMSCGGCGLILMLVAGSGVCPFLSGCLNLQPRKQKIGKNQFLYYITGAGSLNALSRCRNSLYSLKRVINLT